MVHPAVLPEMFVPCFFPSLPNFETQKSKNMGTVADTSNYRITPGTVSIALNALGNANRVQCGVAGGAAIRCFVDGVPGLGYDDNHQYREWPIVIFPTYFNTDTEKYVYVAIPRTPSDGTSAMVVFPSEHVDIYGRNELNEQIAPTTHFYVWLQAVISEVNSEGGDHREWIEEINEGILDTDQGRAIILNINGEPVPVGDDHTIDITTPTKVSDLSNDLGYLEQSDISGGHDVLRIGEKNINLKHKHDWGDVVNKPNLVEGVTAGNNILSMFLSNGDIVKVDFTSLIGKIARLICNRAMVIEPVVWDSSYTGVDWTENIDEYFYDTSDGLLKICESVAEGTPLFTSVQGKYLLWHENTASLMVYTYRGGSSSPSLITIYPTT